MKPDGKQRARARRLWYSLAPPWPEEGERARHLAAIASALLEVGSYSTYAGLMRTVGVPESVVWAHVERVAEARDEDPSEVFRDLFEPEDLDE